MLRIAFAFFFFFKCEIQHWICCLLQCVELRRWALSAPKWVGNGFGASGRHGPLRVLGQFVMLFNASPLPNVLPTFPKLLKIGSPEANCFVSSDNRRYRKGYMSSSPSCGAPSPVEDITQAGAGRTSRTRGWAMALLSLFPLDTHPRSSAGQDTCRCPEWRHRHGWSLVNLPNEHVLSSLCCRTWLSGWALSLFLVWRVQRGTQKMCFFHVDGEMLHESSSRWC